MIKSITRDSFFLQQKAKEATKADLYLEQDLKDTLLANQENCLGLAANMIGVNKKAIIISMGAFPLVLFNPQLTSKEGLYQTKEGCLSLDGTRPTSRYQKITVTYRDAQWKQQTLKLEGLFAQICQHELDHLQGILI